jgi:UDP:flavonoid glycosyltransferase YjiC (YdhE family)
MWPPSLIQNIVPVDKNIVLENVGLNMFPPTQKNEKNKKQSHKNKTNNTTIDELSKDVLQFIKEKRNNEITSKNLLFMSFGSFARIPHLRTIIPYIIEELLKTHTLIIHKTWKDDIAYCPTNSEGRCFVHEGFIPYDKIIPLVSLVMGSGSLGLQSYCIKHNKPILMVPIITEQYFWAKNFQHFTGLYYIDIADVYNMNIRKQVQKALCTLYKNNSHLSQLYQIKPKVRDFVLKISKEMKERDMYAFAKPIIKKLNESIQ